VLSACASSDDGGGSAATGKVASATPPESGCGSLPLPKANDPEGLVAKLPPETKFKTVAGTKDAPAIMQTFEVGTKFMIDSGKIQPVQKFIDQDHYDTSQWEKNISSYYQVDGKQYSMPFKSSTPVLV